MEPTYSCQQNNTPVDTQVQQPGLLVWTPQKSLLLPLTNGEQGTLPSDTLHLDHWHQCVSSALSFLRACLPVVAIDKWEAIQGRQLLMSIHASSTQYLPTARLVQSLALIERQKTDTAIWLRRRKFKSSSSNLVPKRRSSIGIYILVVYLWLLILNSQEPD